MLFLFVILGLVVGCFIAGSSEQYINLITSKNKVLYSYINGTADYFKIFWNKFSAFILPLVLIVGLGLHFYSTFFIYLFLAYQSSLFILSCTALIKIYGISGFLNVLLFVVPINLVYMLALICVSAICISRSLEALKNKQFLYGYNQSYFSKITLVILFIFVLTLTLSLIMSVFLKNANFLFY